MITGPNEYEQIALDHVTKGKTMYSEGNVEGADMNLLLAQIAATLANASAIHQQTLSMVSMETQKGTR